MTASNYFLQREAKRGGPASLDRFAAKLSYNRFFDVTPLVSCYQGYAPDKSLLHCKPHPVLVQKMQGDQQAASNPRRETLAYNLALYVFKRIWTKVGI